MASGLRIKLATIVKNPKSIVIGRIGRIKILANGEIIESFWKLKRIIGKTKNWALNDTKRISKIKETMVGYFFNFSPKYLSNKG